MSSTKKKASKERERQWECVNKVTGIDLNMLEVSSWLHGAQDTPIDLSWVQLITNTGQPSPVATCWSVGKPDESDSMFRSFAEIQTHETFEKWIHTISQPDCRIVLRTRDGNLSICPISEASEAKERMNYCSSLLWDEIEAMGRCVQLWDLIREGEESKLAYYFPRTNSRKNGPAISFDPAPSDLTHKSHLPGPEKREPIASNTVRPGMLVLMPPGDSIRPARYYVQKTINEHLRGQVTARILRKESPAGMAIFFVPTNLIAALWLQFALAFAYNKDHYRCAECGTWYEVSPDGARSTRRYCSDACKMQAYRTRKERALE